MSPIQRPAAGKQPQSPSLGDQDGTFAAIALGISIGTTVTVGHLLYTGHFWWALTTGLTITTIAFLSTYVLHRYAQRATNRDPNTATNRLQWLDND